MFYISSEVRKLSVNTLPVFVNIYLSMYIDHWKPKNKIKPVCSTHSLAAALEKKKKKKKKKDSKHTVFQSNIASFAIELHV